MADLEKWLHEVNGRLDKHQWAYGDTPTDLKKAVRIIEEMSDPYPELSDDSFKKINEIALMTDEEIWK